MPPPNSPPDSPPNLPPILPPGQFHNGPRHAFSANYPYGNGYMGYSGWGAAWGTGHHHRRTRTDMGSRLTRGALARALTATLEAGTASAIFPTTGVIFNSSGRPPAKFFLWSFRGWARRRSAAALWRRIRHPCGRGDSPAAAGAAPAPARRHASSHVYLDGNAFSGSRRSSSERRSPAALHRT